MSTSTISKQVEQTIDHNKIRNKMYGVVTFYFLSFSFWVWSFLNNLGPGGVESQHLVLIGVTHVISLVLHLMAVMSSKDTKD